MAQHTDSSRTKMSEGFFDWLVERVDLLKVKYHVSERGLDLAVHLPSGVIDLSRCSGQHPVIRLNRSLTGKTEKWLKGIFSEENSPYILVDRHNHYIASNPTLNKIAMGFMDSGYSFAWDDANMTFCCYYENEYHVIDLEEGTWVSNIYFWGLSDAWTNKKELVSSFRFTSLSDCQRFLELKKKQDQFVDEVIYFLNDKLIRNGYQCWDYRAEMASTLTPISISCHVQPIDDELVIVTEVVLNKDDEREFARSNALSLKENIKKSVEKSVFALIKKDRYRERLGNTM